MDSLQERFSSRQQSWTGPLALPTVALPSGQTRGWVVFSDRVTSSSAAFKVGASGPGRFVGELFTGTYDVDFTVEDVGPSYKLARGATTRLASGVVVRSGGAYVYDLQVIRVSGEVTLRGAALPDVPAASEQTRGFMAFKDPVTGFSSAFPLGATGPARYEGHVLRGTYDVTFQVNDLGATFKTAKGSFARVAQGVQLTQDASYVYDARLVRVTGELTLNGQPLPDAAPGAPARGWVVFSDVGSASSARLPLPLAGKGTFDGYVFAGTHRMDFAPQSLGAAHPISASEARRLAGCGP